jgi:hypothetical protein
MAYDLDGDDLDGDDLEGDDVDGDDVVGVIIKNPRTGRKQMVPMRRGGGLVKPKRNTITLPNKPNWRKRTIGPGVSAPADDRLIVPLTAQVAGGSFAAAQNNIIFLGRPQKPFQGKRLLVKVVRTGTSATGALLGQLFAGSDLQQGALGRFDIESIGSATAFDTGISMTPVEPGVDISLDVLITPAPTSTDTVLVACFLLGDLVH